VQVGCTINYGRKPCGKKMKEIQKMPRVDYRVTVSENT
jgi:hypothetical protein